MMRSSVCSASTPTSRPCAPSTPWRSSSWRASTPPRQAVSPPLRSVLSESTQELIDRSIAELLSARGLDVASLGQSDRVDVIRHLNGNGVFMLKGAVACAATALGISEPSVYRYLQKVRKEG
ncbi:MAG: helix-turn-helix domain-containing protein [Collinsella sp.]